MTDGAPTPFDDDDTSPPALWDAARYALRWLVNLFGSPAEMAGLEVLAPRERMDVLGWLRPLEALVRALLVIRAAEMPAPIRRTPRAKRSPPRSRQMVEHDPDKPESWRVSFRAVPAPPGLGSGRYAPGAELPSAWPLAERLEAVIRVLENPDPFARRLVGRLRAEPGQSPRILCPPPDRKQIGPREWAFTHARAQALQAIAAFDTS